MESTKRQRVQAPAAAEAPAPVEPNKFNGPCCGGVRFAGAAPGYELKLNTQIQLAKRIKASWVNEKGELRAAKCGNCKKIIVPTGEQLERMVRFKLKSVFEERQLHEIAVASGMTAEEALAMWKDAEDA